MRPSCLRILYNTLDYDPRAANRSSVAFLNFLNETMIHKDLEMFLQRERKDAVGTTIPITIIKEGKDGQNVFSYISKTDGSPADVSREGNLDGQILTALVHPIPVREYNTGGEPPFQNTSIHRINDNEPYLEWLDYMLTNETNLPQTISISYGDDEHTVPRDYATHVCLLFGLLGARGVSILVASGDDGVGGPSDAGHDKCYAGPDGVSRFIAHFPGSCPYVTTVGATKGFGPEVAAEDVRGSYASGGGFSNYFDRPLYQEAAVREYFAKHDPGNITDTNTSKPFQYNRMGRGYPDVAAQGQFFATVWNQRWGAASGTSASTPVVASVVALLNDFLISQEKSPLGFLNPWLYAVGYKGMTDITLGDNKGCRTRGFNATERWDPVTGFGTPVGQPCVLRVDMMLTKDRTLRSCRSWSWPGLTGCLRAT
jgi:tripeptidyl-peptidase-1